MIKDPIREDRIHSEAIVDANGAEEKAMSWYYYLQEKMAFPFKAKCIKVTKKSPLKEGEIVNVINMSGEDECEHNMYVEIDWKKDSLYVPLSQLEGIKVDEDTQEAIEDWHYWINMGYEF